jgi:quinolinate synthase
MTVAKRINQLKKEKNAVLLAHNYQLPEVQDIADYIGDSLGLSIQASQTQASIIVFCGVYFMAETAKILSPEKTVLIPDKDAGCPMADMITADELCSLKKQHPEAKTICYINTPAAVKAECDLCCTSANAITVVKKGLADAKEIIFVPDKYLSHYVATQTKRTFINWDGYCPSHIKILPEDIQRQKELHPHAEVLVHPECIPEVIQLADGVYSTEGMCWHVRETRAQEIIVGTEVEMIHRLKKENPNITYYPASELAICPNMKRITLEKILYALENMKHEILLPDDIINKAQHSIKEMVTLSL